MPDMRPRLVKTTKPISPPPLSKTAILKSVKRSATARKREIISELRIMGTLTYFQQRVRKLQLFEAHLSHDREQWARRQEVLPRYRAMISARAVRSRPLPLERRRWLFSVSPSLAARELFRVEYGQHCPSVAWSPEDPT